MPTGIDGFSREAFQLLLDTLAVNQKELVGKANLSRSTVRTWLSGVRVPTRDALRDAVHVINFLNGCNLRVEDLCGEGATDRVMETIGQRGRQSLALRAEFRELAIEVAEQYVGRQHRRPRMLTWRLDRVNWTHLPGLFQPLPTSSRFSIPDTVVYPFTTYWHFWHRNRNRPREFRSEFELTGRRHYNEADLREIGYFWVREQWLLIAAGFSTEHKSRWYQGTTEYAQGGAADNFGWGREALVETYGRCDLSDFSRRYVRSGLERFLAEYPHLRRFFERTE